MRYVPCVQDFRQLEVWHTSMDLAKACYQAVPTLPNDERFGFATQIKRGAVSVPSNIAEGCGRNSRRELAYFIGVAIGSLFELETQIEIANDLYGLPSIGELFEKLNATKAKLLKFRAAVRRQMGTESI